MSSGGWFIEAGYEEVILPALWEQQTFIDKAGPEIVNQMWAFQDKGGRDVCLIPESTAIIQETWRKTWSKSTASRKIFSVGRTYRYERPQLGRYREFTQFNVDILGDCEDGRDQVVGLLQSCLDKLGVNYDFDASVKRGLAYYTEDGFEASCSTLGSQKQIAGGGRYAEGVGWAIGIDRLLLALG